MIEFIKHYIRRWWKWSYIEVAYFDWGVVVNVYEKGKPTDGNTFFIEDDFTDDEVDRAIKYYKKVYGITKVLGYNESRKNKLFNV